MLLDFIEVYIDRMYRRAHVLPRPVRRHIVIANLPEFTGEDYRFRSRSDLTRLFVSLRWPQRIGPMDNGQFCDKGSSYRSAVFVETDDQREAVEAEIEEIEDEPEEQKKLTLTEVRGASDMPEVGECAAAAAAVEALLAQVQGAVGTVSRMQQKVDEERTANWDTLQAWQQQRGSRRSSPAGFA